MMESMTTIMNRAIDVSKSLSDLLKDVEPYKQRMFAFLSAHDVAGYVHETSPLHKHDVAVDYYVLDLSAFLKTGELRFHYEYTDYDDVFNVEFPIPAEYLADPDAWEKALLVQTTKDRGIGIDVIRNVFGEEVFESSVTECEPRTINIVNDKGGVDSHEFLMFYIRPRKSGLGLTDRHKELFANRSDARFAWKRETGEVFSADVTGYFKLVKGQTVEPVGAWKA